MKDLKLKLPQEKGRFVSVNIIFDENRKIVFNDMIYNKRETKEKLSFDFYNFVIVFRKNKQQVIMSDKQTIKQLKTEGLMFEDKKPKKIIVNQSASPV